MAKAKAEKAEEIDRVAIEDAAPVVPVAQPESDQVGLYDTKTFGNPEAAKAEKPVAPKKEKPVVVEAGEYTILVNVKHDGVLFEAGSEYELDSDKATLFKRKGWIK